MLRPCFLASLLCLTALVAPGLADDTRWPEPDADSKPWLRWWWPSDLACPEDPKEELQQIAARGFGGVEILPLGEEDPLWPGPGWAPRVAATGEAAEELKIGFDLATHFGESPTGYGPEDTSQEWYPFRANLEGGPTELELPAGTFYCLAAWPPQGPPVDLIDAIEPESGKLIWEAPAGQWKVFGLYTNPASTRLDPFSAAATKDSLMSFDLSFADYEGPIPRSRPLQRTSTEFADWTPDLFEQFIALRGYDLREQLPALLGDGPGGTIERVRCDYRETLSDLYRHSLETWQQHTRIQGALTRTLLHGQAAHPLEIHGVADFPGVARNPAYDPELHLAASAAHLTMKPMVVATLTPDRSTTPATLKRDIDHLWIQGANHLILDGRSSLLDPSRGQKAFDSGSGLWSNLEPMTSYITRCQTILQLGAPDPDLLLYYPAHDFWTERGGIPRDPDERREWLRPSGYQRAYEGLTKRGVLFDTVSDRLLRHAELVEGGRILIGGLTYNGLILPDVRRLPEQTGQKLLELARRGAKIGALGELPQDVPGYPSPDIRRGTLIRALQQFPTSSTMESDYLDDLIEHLGIRPESLTKAGLRFIRRSHPDGWHYFVLNPTAQTIRTQVSLSRPTKSVVLLDPRDPRSSGRTELQTSGETWSMPLHLEPGESVILRTLRDRDAEAPIHQELDRASRSRVIGGDWSIQLEDLTPRQTSLLGSWRSLPQQPEPHSSATAVYELEFTDAEGKASILDLGEVAHTASVRFNGKDLGASYAPPHRFAIADAIKPGSNKLEVTVTSLSNPELPCGLIGPVRLILPQVSESP